MNLVKAKCCKTYGTGHKCANPHLYVVHRFPVAGVEDVLDFDPVAGEGLYEFVDLLGVRGHTALAISVERVFHAVVRAAIDCLSSCRYQIGAVRLGSSSTIFAATTQFDLTNP
jgi:hypothetical protein